MIDKLKLTVQGGSRYISFDLPEMPEEDWYMPENANIKGVEPVLIPSENIYTKKEKGKCLIPD